MKSGRLLLILQVSSCFFQSGCADHGASRFKVESLSKAISSFKGTFSKRPLFLKKVAQYVLPAFRLFTVDSELGR